MITLSNKEIERLTSIYLVANTPSFIWSRFSSDASVVALTNKSTIEEILNTLDSIDLELPSKSPREVTKAYILLTAMCLKFPAELIKQFNQIKFKQLIWGRNFINYANKRLIGYTPIELHAKPKANVPVSYSNNLEITTYINGQPSKTTTEPKLFKSEAASSSKSIRLGGKKC